MRVYNLPDDGSPRCQSHLGYPNSAQCMKRKTHKWRHWTILPVFRGGYVNVRWDRRVR